MLVSFEKEPWWFMEVPRTGTSTIERGLRKIFTCAEAPYSKHWPVVPRDSELGGAISVISIRDPFSRAVSCWQYFTKPGSISFVNWTYQRCQNGWMDAHVEARPQSFWYKLWHWDVVIRQEHLEDDFWGLIQGVSPDTERFELNRYNDINGPWVNRVKAKTYRDRPWQDYYCSKSEENVRELYREDFVFLSRWYDGKITKS